ncbi:MAG TPA: hypothetical protein VJV05_11935, partial [Pyrinomonadaceae bacterium]|nr:hypothetical protein [Pyrinomonadaceae bacterium]
MKSKLIVSFVLLILPVIAAGQNYKSPPKEIMDVLNAPAIPAVSISPTRDRLALLEPLRYPPIAELAQPMLRLAGSRINPNTNGQHRQPYSVSIKLKSIADGKETAVVFPSGAQIMQPQWSPDGKHIAAGNITASGIELWIIDTTTAKATKVKNVMINTAFGGFSWEDSRTISATLVSAKRGPAPGYQNLTPMEPNIQETTGRGGAVQTFQDMLKSPNDEKLFEYYATSQIALIDLDGKVREIGGPGIFDSVDFSPDGKYILTARIERPFSYLFPSSRFPKKVEVWDTSGKVVHTVANIPLQDSLPIQGVTTAPRGYSWIPAEPATLMWAEALDGGDPRKKVSPRDKLMTIAAPFSAAPAEFAKTEHRYQGRVFGEKDGLMWFFDYDRDSQHRRIFMTDYRNPAKVTLVSDLDTDDRYNDIGQPVMKQLANGTSVMRQNGDYIFLSGTGASPDGDRPFFRRMNLKTLKTEEIFRSGTEDYEAFLGMVDDAGTTFLTRKESTTEPPNVYFHQTCPPGTNCIAVV